MLQVVATDRDMKEFTATEWLAKHPRPGMRELVVGLGGEPYWLLSERDPDHQVSWLYETLVPLSLAFSLAVTD